MDFILQIVDLIEKYNKAYRTGNALVSDEEYDELKETLRTHIPDHELLNQVGYINPNDERKEKLMYPMFSMDKVKTLDEYNAWLKSKQINKEEEFIITPKYDGLSFLANEKTGDGWTRGDGVYGQRSTEHFGYIKNGNLDKNLITIGEMIMSRDNFDKNYSETFKNPRNLMAGLFNTKDPREKKDYFNNVDFIRYGIIHNDSRIDKKSKEIDVLNKFQHIKVPYKILNAGDVTEELVKTLFEEWSTQYEIDGVIVEANNYATRTSLGRETNNNPSYAIAFKGDFEEKKETKVLEIKKQISRTGRLKPVLSVEPITLNGVTVSNVTGNNYKFIKDNNIGVGSIILVKRSGMVIPKIVTVLHATGFEMPTDVDVRWDENGVELMLNDITDEQNIKQITHFFKSIGVDELGEGISKILYESGLTTIKQILKATKFDLIKIPGIGEKKAITLIKRVNEKLNNIPLHIIQNASGFFNLLGEKKLKLVSHFKNKPTIDELLEISGIGEKNAEIYLENYDRFINFVTDLNINYTVEEKATDGMLFGIHVCFTGIRDKEVEQFIKNNGGEVIGSITTNCSYLVCKDVNEKSSKITKAKQKNIKVLTLTQFKDLW